MEHRRSVWVWLLLVSSALLLVLSHTPALVTPTQAAGSLNLNAANRRAPIVGLPNWSKAGYRGGADLPGSSAIGNTISATSFGVIANDGQDDSAPLQAAIDSVKNRVGAGFSNLTLLNLPSGTINLSRQIAVDASYVLIRGQGSDPGSSSATKIEFRPDATTRYDLLTADGSQPDFPNMTSGSASGGWIWPGRGAFRVQVRDVHTSYQSEHSSAPTNRKDLFEGSVNFHWKTGLRVKQGLTYAARIGDTVLPLDSSVTSSQMAALQAGGLLWVGSANSIKEYQAQGVTNTAYYENGHMKAQVFTISAVNSTGKTVTIDKPLEFDLLANNTSDGSAAIGGAIYYSKVMPLTAVQGVGFENFYMTQVVNGMPKLGGGVYSVTPAQAERNYGNLAPEYAQHGIVFKWAANSWVRGVRMSMTGSHPIVTEVAKNLQIQDTVLSGSWNKGKGGNGYFRGSRVWDSLYANNTTSHLRHFTFQWSASNNVAIGNTFDSDINLHGGWERRNLIELNNVQVPYNHSSGSCTANCGGEGGGADDGTWYPIYWGAGAKAGKWSGATGQQNVLFNNTLKKQLVSGGAYNDYQPYYASDGSKSHTIFQLGWDRASTTGSTYQHLAKSGTLIADWASNETVDYATAPNAGVNALRTDPGVSLFLIAVNGAPATPVPTTPTPVPTTAMPTPTLTPRTPTPTSAPITGRAEVRAALVEDSNKQTKYDITITNTGTSPLSGFSGRVYVDISEVLASGLTASDLRCAERYDPSGQGTCALVPYSGNVYYAKLDFGSLSLAAGASVQYKITLHLNNYATIWNSSNDYSRVGLSTSNTLTSRIPLYQGSTLIYGTNP